VINVIKWDKKYYTFISYKVFECAKV
jgi:hypothetical protein